MRAQYVFAALLVLSAPLAAQERPDRSQPPALGPVVPLTLPEIQKHTLTNGLPVCIV